MRTFSRFFNKTITKNFSLLQTQMKYSSFKIALNNGAIATENNVNINLNWQLARTWVNPSNRTHLNSVQARQVSGDSGETSVISGDIKAYEYDRFVRKFGLVISRESNVFVQDGVYNGKKVRLVTSAQEDAEFFSQIFSEKVDNNENPDLHVMYLSNNANIGTSKRFLYFSKVRRSLLSNSRNVDNIKKGLDSL